MINIRNVSKYYGRNLGISDISFDVEKNEIVGLIGMNGAGKTTTMNIITGYISFDEGSVEIDGCDIVKEPQKAKAKIGYLPEKPPIYLDMTVNEYLQFCAELRGIDKELQQNHLDEICTLTGINEVRTRLCGNLSKGYKQRVGLAQALVGNPEILILDEPTIGLDPNQIIQIRKLIKKLSETHTIIVSSHVLTEITQICNKVIILKEGKIAVSDTLTNLMKAEERNETIEIRIKNAEDSFADELKKSKYILSVDVIGEEEKNCMDFVIGCKNADKARESVFNIAAKSNKLIFMMKQKENTLEEIFQRVTSGTMEGKE